uniref:Estradiol 17-beta-dehydrogenase 2 n=1 Tax=Elaeophora elaphi TaxID=1147741 RepID=A0A0R3RNZ9_9BILA
LANHSNVSIEDVKSLANFRIFFSVFHALINNAGLRGNIFYDEFLILDDYKEVWNVNMCGVIRVTQTFRDLIKKSRGRIVICGSAITMFPTAGGGPYSVSKFGVQAYCTIVRQELRPYGVDVIEIIPGSFQSGMQSAERLTKMIDEVWYRAPQKLRDEFGQDYNERAKKFTNELQQNIVEQDTTWVIDAYYEA